MKMVIHHQQKEMITVTHFWCVMDEHSDDALLVEKCSLLERYSNLVYVMKFVLSWTVHHLFA